jgi:hypothetical protein
MKTEQLNTLKNRSSIIKSLPRPLKILLFIFIGIALLMSSLWVGEFGYCHTVAICDSRPPISSEMIATQMADQYEYALLDINARRYKNAKQRLEYVLSRDPEYPGAKEKLSEVEKLLNLTPTP